MQCTKLSIKDTAVNKIKVILNSQEFMGAGEAGLEYHLQLMS